MAKLIIAKSNRGTPELIGLHDIAGDQVNPSTEDKQDDAIALLEQIEQNTQNIDIDMDSLVIDAKEINLNTDDLEDLQQETIDAIGQESGSTVLTRLKDLWDKLFELFNTGVARCKIWDGTNIAKVDATGRMLVASNIVAPPATTPVIVIQKSVVSTTIDYFYIIPNGETLTIQRLSGGAEIDSVAGSNIELYDDINGDLSVLNLIDVIYASGNSDQNDLDESFVGDGTRRIVLRRNRFSGGGKEIYGKWEGYY